MPGEDENYGGGGPTLARTPTTEPATEKGDGQTYLINKDVCPGMSVGDEIVVKIEAVHDKEYAVSYSKPEEENEAEGDEGMAPETAPGAGEGAGAGESMYG